MEAQTIDKTKDAFSFREVAALLGVQPLTVRNWRRAGWINAVMTGHGQYAHYEITRSDLEAFMAERGYQFVC